MKDLLTRKSADRQYGGHVGVHTDTANTRSHFHRSTGYLSVPMNQMKPTKSFQ